MPKLNPIEVACGIFLKENKVFLTKRKKNVHLANKWEFPGGKKNKNETIEACLIRELEEEVSVFSTKFNLFEKTNFTYDECHVSLYFYLIECYQGELQANEGQISCWIEINQLEELDFPKANQGVIQKLKNHLN